MSRWTFVALLLVAGCSSSQPPSAGTPDAVGRDAGDDGAPDARAEDDAGAEDATADAAAVGDAETDAGTPDAGAAADAAAMEDADLGAAADAAELERCAPRPFGPEVSTPGATTSPTDYGSAGPLAVQLNTDVPSPSWPDHPGTVARPANLDAYPVLFYSHAYGGTDPTHIEQMLRRLASNGYNVVFIPYRTTGSRTEQYDTLWNGFLSAVSQYGARFDLSRVGFFGHSFGGGASPELARRAFADPQANGLPDAWGTQGRFIMSMAPWYSYPNLKQPTATNDNYRALPLDTKVIIQVFGDDDTNDHLIALHDIWEKLPAGLVDKSWQLIPSDGCNGQWLNAGHSVPATFNGMPVGSGYNAHDVWGVARRILALADYSFHGGGAAARAIAFPSSEAERSMGNWVDCGGRPVVALRASETTPISSRCSGGGGAGARGYVFDYSADAHCRFADQGAPLCR